MRKTYKLLIVLPSFLLSSCGGSGSEAQEETTLIQFVEPEDAITYVNNSQNYDNTALFLTSVINGATVYVQSDLSKLIIDGSNNLLNIAEGVSVKGCEVTGNDNTVILPEGIVLSCEVTGAGNNGFNAA